MYIQVQVQRVQPLADPSERTLARARQRDESAFAELVREYQGMVYGLAYHTTADPAAAEDVAQEVFLRLHQSLSAIESTAHLTSWLRRVTCQRCIDLGRRRSARPEVTIETVPEPATSGPATRDSLLDHRLRQLVASLTPRARAIVTLRYQEDLLPAEIAELLGAPVNTVKSVLQRSLAILRTKLERAVVERR
jgi:RNA polymerase sigma-70 factor, ECF subfamily